MVAKIDRLNRTISFKGSVATAQMAFDVPIMAFGNGAVYANTKAPMIPSEFAGVIGAINGLDNMRKAVPMALNPPLGEALAGSGDAGPRVTINGKTAFGPTDFRTFYHELAIPDGTGTTCIAIVGDSDFLQAAVHKFNTQFALPDTVPTVCFGDRDQPGEER